MGSPVANFLVPGVGGKILAPVLFPDKSKAVPPRSSDSPQADSPDVVAARKKQREAALKRKGRASLITTGGAGVTSDAPLSQPQALGA
jgi:hypothetical protein